MLCLLLIATIPHVSGDSTSFELELIKISEIQTGGVAIDIQIINDTLYVADHLGLLIYNVSNPNHPQKIGEKLDTGTSHGIHVKGNFAFVADLDDGLEVYDISDPRNPQKIATYFNGRDVTDLFVQDSFCYASVDESEFAVLYVSDPTNITKVGHYDIVSGINICCINNTAFVADYTAGLLILDISNASNPQLIGMYNDGDIVRGIDVEDNIVYASCGTDGGFKTIDANDPSNPVLRGEYQNISRGIGVVKKDDYVFVCDYDEGLKILDVKNPLNPTLCGSYSGNRIFGVNVVKEYAYLLQSGGIIQIIQIKNLPSSTSSSTALESSTSSSTALESSSSSSTAFGFELVYFIIGLGIIALLQKNEKYRRI